MDLSFKVDAWQGMVNIDTDQILGSSNKSAFTYCALTSELRGIQVNDDTMKEDLKVMCDKITEAIYEFQSKVKHRV